MAASSKVLDLRKLLAERFPQGIAQRSGCLTTEIAPLDEVTGGGIPTGAITELVSAHASTGSAGLIHALLHKTQRDRGFLALIDGRDSFDPSASREIDNRTLQHLLWVRCHDATEAVKAADLLLRDGNFRLVILDLVLNATAELRRIPQTSWYRLQRLVEPSAAALLVLARQTLISSAQLKLVLENRWTLRDLNSDTTSARLTFRLERVHGGKIQLAQTG